jgi:hypothetical protein
LFPYFSQYFGYFLFFLLNLRHQLGRGLIGEVGFGVGVFGGKVSFTKATKDR